jgi:dehydrogenase/reductase SDR family member 7B
MVRNHKIISLLVSGFIFSSLVVCASGLSVTSSLKMSPDDAACNTHAQSIFRGQNVLLTGASGGLGRAFALQMAHCRARMLVLSGRNPEALQTVADECKSIHPDIITHIITADLASPEAVQHLANIALEATSGRVDILINNGGVSSRSRFVDTKLEVDQQLMQVNFFAGAALAKAIIPGMIERGFGKIIWVSSVQGLMGIPNRTSYAASKFAVQGYCEALRGEVATSGVTIHVASPGYIRTNLSRSAITGDGRPHGQMDATTASGEFRVPAVCFISYPGGSLFVCDNNSFY